MAAPSTTEQLGQSSVMPRHSAFWFSVTLTRSIATSVIGASHFGHLPAFWGIGIPRITCGHHLYSTPTYPRGWHHIRVFLMRASRALSAVQPVLGERT